MANTKITTNVIADDAITTAKIADDAVGNDQLASGLTLGGNTTATLSTAAQPNITSLGTLSALTISGDLTVDTSTLKVDSSNNRVGVGTASPQALFHAAATNTTVWPFTSAQSGTYSYTPYPHELVVDNDTTGNEGSFASIFFNAGADSDGSKLAAARIGAVETGNYKADLVFGTRNTSFQERMRILADGKVGIGTSSPGVELDVNGDIRLLGTGTDNDSHILYFNNGAAAIARDNNDLELHAYNAMIFGVSNTSYPTSTERMRIDTSGLVTIQSGQVGLKVEGSGSGYVQGSILLSSAASGSNAYRGHGIFYWNNESQTEWFLGAPYTDSDRFVINRKASQSSPDYSSSYIHASHGQNFLTIENDGKVGIGITSPGGLPLQTKVSSGDNKFRQTTASKDAFTLGLDNSTGDTIIGTHTTYPHTTFKDNGNVGIGISSPTQKLDVRGGSGAGTLTHAIFTGTSSRGLEIRTRSDTSGGQNSGTAEINSADSEGTGGDLAFSSNGNVRMFIDGGGNVGIGTTSPDTFLDIEHTTNTHLQGIHITNKQTGGYGSAIRFNSRRSDGGQSVEEAAQIRVEGASSWNSDGTTHSHLLFSTRHNNTLAERMRIKSNGVFIHGKTTDDVDTIGWIVSTNGSVYSSTNSSNNSYHYRDTTNTRYNFYVGGNGQVNARVDSIAQISDGRLKENVRDYTVGLNDILKLKPRVFDWISPKEGEKDQVGFIAQEFEEVFPDWISNFLHDDLEDAKSVRATSIIYPMVNAIKELKAEIDALKEKLNG